MYFLKTEKWLSRSFGTQCSLMKCLPLEGLNSVFSRKWVQLPKSYNSLHIKLVSHKNKVTGALTQSLNVQSDSIQEKLFVWYCIFKKYVIFREYFLMAYPDWYWNLISTKRRSFQSLIICLLVLHETFAYEDSSKTFAKSFDSFAILSSRNDLLWKARFMF